MPLLIIPALGMMLRSAGTAAMTSARAAGGGLLRNLGGANIARDLGALMRPLPQGEGPLKFSMAHLQQRIGEKYPTQKEISRERRRISEINQVKGTEDKPSRNKQAGDLAKSSAKTLSSYALLASATVFTAKKLTDLGKSINDLATNDLRVFNAAIASLAAKKELFGIEQQVRRGKAVQGTTVELGESMMRFQKAAQPYKNLIENTKNFIVTKLTDSMATILNFMNGMGIKEATDAINKEYGGEKENNKQIAIDMLRQLSLGSNIAGTAANRRPNETPGSRF